MILLVPATRTIDKLLTEGVLSVALISITSYIAGQYTQRFGRKGDQAMDTPELLCALRNEIIESQKTQAEFLKWKLIAVSAVSSISLGFERTVKPPPDPRGLQLLLCAIPFICAYIDFVSLHIMIRIVTIGAYLRKMGSEYESFVFRTRKKGVNPFVFETAALHGSSIVFNLTLIGLSFAGIATLWIPSAYFWCGVLGLVVAAVSWIFYETRARRVRKLAESHD